MYAPPLHRATLVCRWVVPCRDDRFCSRWATASNRSRRSLPLRPVIRGRLEVTQIIRIVLTGCCLLAPIGAQAGAAEVIVRRDGGAVSTPGASKGGGRAPPAPGWGR